MMRPAPQVAIASSSLVGYVGSCEPSATACPDRELSRVLCELSKRLRWRFRFCIAIAGLTGCSNHADSTKNGSIEICPVLSANKLTTLDVFNGDPKDIMILKPDDGDATHAIWHLRYVYDQGRAVSIRCWYSDGASRDVRLDKPVDKCSYQVGRDGAASVTCA
jgi:hypothetical protein